jgi:hypothetical protein
VQNVFHKVGINRRAKDSGQSLAKIIIDGPPKLERGGSEFINFSDRFAMLNYYRGVSYRARELIGFDLIPELRPLAKEIEKCAAFLETILSKAEQKYSPIQWDGFTDELDPILGYVRDCVDAYVNPLAPSSERGRDLVRSARQPIENRRTELEDTLGFLLEAYHWEREYEKYKSLPIRKREHPQPWFYPRIGYVETKFEIISRAGRYLDLPWMQCRAATDLFLLAVLDTEFIPLDRKVQVFRRYNIVMDTVPRLVSLGIVIGWIAYVFAVDRTFAGVGMAMAAWLLVGPLFVRKLEAWAVNLRDIRTEVSNRAYDADAIAARLKSAEEGGAAVPTITYGLLKLRALQQSL